MDGHEQACPGGAVADGLKKGVVGTEDRRVLRDDVGKRGRNRRPRGKTMAILEQVAEYPFDPRGGRANVVGVEVGKVAAYLGPSLGLEVVEAVRPHPAQDRKGEEWPAWLDKGEPVRVDAGDAPAHRRAPRLPCATAGGRRNVTAAGNRRGTGSA